MFHQLLITYPDYTIVEKPISAQVEKYRSRVPPEIIEVWEKYGFGIFLDGYLKIVNPAEYDTLLKESYALMHPNATVLFATAMADLIIWEDGYLVLVNYRHGKADVIGKSAKLFFKNLVEEAYLVNKLHWQPYEQVRARLGEPAYDECYGYVPLLALGGAEQADKLQRVKLREHISLIAGFAGVLS